MLVVSYHVICIVHVIIPMGSGSLSCFELRWDRIGEKEEKNRPVMLDPDWLCCVSWSQPGRKYRESHTALQVRERFHGVDLLG